MPIACTLVLNDRKFSLLDCEGVGTFRAFSGTRNGRDDPADVAMADIGPLPPGRCSIVVRRSGGQPGIIRDYVLEHMNPIGFATLRDALLKTKPMSVPGFPGTAYGTVDVK